MATSVKAINALKTKFSINGKLAVMTKTTQEGVLNFKYSRELTTAENKSFKQYLSDSNII